MLSARCEIYFLLRANSTLQLCYPDVILTFCVILPLVKEVYPTPWCGAPCCITAVQVHCTAEDVPNTCTRVHAHITMHASHRH